MTKQMMILAAVVLAMLAALPVAAQSAMSIGEPVMKPGTRVLMVPVYIETDGLADGEPLQAMAFRVSYSPQDAISSATVRRAGVIGSRKPSFEAVPLHENTVSYMAMFPRQERLRFTSMAGDRNLIAYIELTLAEGVSEDTTVALTLDPKISTLANADGTREQSAARGTLRIGAPMKQSLRHVREAAAAE